MNRLEAVARAICVDKGLDPDKLVGHDYAHVRGADGLPASRNKVPTRHGPLWTGKKAMEEARRFLACFDAATKGELA